jgi:hypothetical protein
MLDGAQAEPIHGVRFYYLAEEFASGNRHEKSNPLR